MVIYIPLPIGTTTYTFENLEGGEKMVYILDSGNCVDGGPFETGTGVFENLPAGPHSIAVRHPNGCVKITNNAIPLSLLMFVYPIISRQMVMVIWMNGDQVAQNNTEI